MHTLSPTLISDDDIFDYKIGLYPLSLEEINSIIRLFFRGSQSTDASIESARHKIHSININGLNILQEDPYFFIGEFMRLIEFWNVLYAENPQAQENIYTLTFHYLSKVAPHALAFDSIDKNSETDILKMLNDIIFLLERLGGSNMLKEYLNRGGENMTIAEKTLSRLLGDIRRETSLRLQAFKELDTKISPNNLSDTNLWHTTYKALYQPFQEVLQLLAEKGHPDMIRLSKKENHLQLSSL